MAPGFGRYAQAFRRVETAPSWPKRAWARDDRSGRLKKRFAEMYLGWRGWDIRQGLPAVLASGEGPGPSVGASSSEVRASARPTAACRSGNARSMPGTPADMPRPYLRDRLISQGFMVDTLETSVLWEIKGRHVQPGWPKPSAAPSAPMTSGRSS